VNNERNPTSHLLAGWQTRGDDISDISKDPPDLSLIQVETKDPPTYLIDAESSVVSKHTRQVGKE